MNKMILTYVYRNERKKSGEGRGCGGTKERDGRCLLIVIPLHSENFYRFKIDVIRCRLIN